MTTIINDEATYYTTLMADIAASEAAIAEAQADQDTVQSLKEGNDVLRTLLHLYDENEALRYELEQITRTNKGPVRTIDIGGQPMASAMKPLTTAEREAQRLAAHREFLVCNYGNPDANSWL